MSAGFCWKILAPGHLLSACVPDEAASLCCRLKKEVHPLSVEPALGGSAKSNSWAHAREWIEPRTGHTSGSSL